MNIRQTHRLQRQLMLMAMVGILITGLVVGLATAIPLYQHTRHYNEMAMGFQVSSQAQALSQLLGKYLDIAQQFSSRSQIRDRLEMYNRAEISQAELIDYTVPRMSDALGQASDVLALLRLDVHGELAVPIGEIPDGLRWQISRLDSTQALLHGPREANGALYLLVSSPIFNRTGIQVGTDLVVVQLDGLAALMATHQAFGNDIRQYIYNKRMGLIFALDKEMQFYPMSGEQAEHLLAQRQETEQPTHFTDEVSTLAYFQELPNLADWELVITLPESSIQRSAQQQLLLPLLTILLMLALSLIVTNRLMRPLSSQVIESSRKLSELSQEQQVLLDLAHGFAFRLDTHGVIHYATPGIEQVLGTSPAELPIHQGRLNLDEASNQEASQQLRQLLLHANEPPPFLITTRHTNGQTVVLEVHARAMLDDGKVTGIRAIARDVTQRIEAEQSLAKSNQEWSYAMDFFDHAIYLVDLEDRVVRANRAFLQLLGASREEVIGKNIVEIMHPHGELKECPVCRARRLRQDAYIVLDGDDPDNPVGRPIEVTTRIIHDADGQATGVLMGMQDLTRSRQTEEQLRLAASVFEGSHEAIMIMSTDQRIINVNQAFCTITGYSHEQVQGRPLSDFLSTEQFGDETAEHIRRVIEEDDTWQGELWYRREDGGVFPAWQNLSVVRNSMDRPVRFIGVFTDISEQKASEARIQRLAHYDLLTELPNRVLLMDRLHSAVERMRRGQKQLAVLFLDLDRFKNVNDSLGHPVGDRMLKVVAERLMSVMREEDTVARLGGDEFLIIIEDLHDPQHAALVARKALDSLAQAIMVEHHQLFIGASIGISLFPEDGDEADTLITNADTAMYRAKETGRNTFQFYTPELTQRSLERFELERDLRLALERNELLLHFQPQASVATASCLGAEALVRWRHPEKGLITPDRFILLAEETGLILELGRWVLLQACQQAVEWQQQGIPLRIAVNLSGKQIIHGNIVETVAQVLADTQLDPALLELEITEGFVLSHAEQGIQTLEQLKTLGLSLAIDDFGTGYSSLSYLKRLPIDRLKIDKSFVQGVSEDPDDAAIATTIIAMGRSLRLDVLAEGVETQAQLDFMMENGCHEFQGYFFSRPLPADEFIAWCQQQRSD
ncbi:MAG: EAL and GGDEF domain-containing protein [Thiohalomonadaceae bacterium]